MAQASPATLSWTCQFDAPKGSTHEAAPDGSTSGPSLTVGQVVDLTCHGPEVLWKQESLKIETDYGPKGNSRFVLKSVGVKEVTPEKVTVPVTSYLVGQHQAEHLFLSDGEHRVPITGFEWTVNSVIEAQQGQEVKPFGAIQPFRMSIPVAVFVTGFIFLLLVGVLIARWIRKANQRRRIIQDLGKFKTPRTPVDELFKDLRAMDRKLDFTKAQPTSTVLDIDHAFRLFLVREFIIPALEWGARDIVREIKKKHLRVYKKIGPQLSRALVELSEAKKRTNEIPPQDMHQLVELVRKTAEGIAQARTSKGRS